jgi:hypothetical protein
MAYKASEAGLALDMKYFQEEISYRRFDERVALSRRPNHGKGRGLGSMNVYWNPLRRPILCTEIDSYLRKASPSGSMEPAVFDNMKAHWSVARWLKERPKYDAERQHFEALDRAVQSLPVVDEKETLLP